jgi:hypothetical protein
LVGYGSDAARLAIAVIVARAVGGCKLRGLKAVHFFGGAFLSLLLSDFADDVIRI